MRLREWLGALCLILLAGLAAPGFARSPDRQFSANGNYFAQAFESQNKVVVRDYTDWPAKPVQTYEINFGEVRLTNALGWRISNTGAVWLVRSQGGLMYFPLDPRDATGNFNDFFTSKNPAFKNVVFGMAKDEALFMFAKTSGVNNVDEIRCELTLQIFTEGGADRLCRSKPVFAGSVGFPPSSPRTAVICTAYCISPTSVPGLDYTILIHTSEGRKAYVYAVGQDHTYSDDYRRGEFKAGYFVERDSPMDLRRLNMHTFVGDVGPSVELPHDDNVSLRWDMTPDGGYVILGGTNYVTRATAILSLDMRHPSQILREIPVQTKYAPDIKISPNGRFLLYDDDTKAMPLGLLTGSN